MRLKVCAYCRVSTDKEDQLNSMRNQTLFFTDYIKSRPEWEFIGIYSDEGISGTSAAKRIGFNAMMEECRRGGVNIILTKEVSRFARNTVDTLNYTRELKRMGVYVIFISDGIDTRDNDGEFRLTIMAGIAQEESRKISDRVKWGQKRAMEHGVLFGADRVYGFVRNGGELSPDPSEADVVRLIYRKLLYEGKGTHIIARELNELNIPPPRAGMWSGVTVLRIIRSEKYCGDLIQGKSVTVDYLTHKRAENKDAEKIYIPDHHPPIIPRDMWRRAQELLSERAAAVHRSAKYWCSGKIVCGECGKRFIAKKFKNRAYVIWCCRCGMRSINSRALEECTKKVLTITGIDVNKLICDTKELVTTVLRKGDGADVNAVRKRVAVLEGKRDRVLESYFSGIIEREDMEKFKKVYDDEIARIAPMCDASENAEEVPEIGDLQPYTSRNVYSAAVRLIRVYTDRIEIALNGTDKVFCVVFCTKGYKENYKVVFEDIYLS